MARFSFAVPVVPGKDALEIPRRLRARMSEYEESVRHARLTMDRAYLQPTPMGDFVVLYYEGELEFPQFMEAQLTSGLAIDRDLIAWVAEFHDIDLTQPAPGPPPELIGEWHDPDVRVRKAGLAFTAPLAPGKADAARRFAREAFVTRRDELTASRRALAESHEHVFLNSTPMGDFVCVYLEGDDPQAGNRGFAASQSPYDRWFKDECTSVFATGIDFDQPLPSISTIWDWTSVPVAT